MEKEKQETKVRRGELQKPFVDAYQLLIKTADNLGFLHDFDLDDALSVAQANADRRANGEADPDPTEAIFAPLGQLPYIMLSYLGQMPPTALLSAFKTRTERILGYITDGSIDCQDGVGDRIELVHSRIDLRTLRKRWLKTPEGETPLTNNELMEALVAWCGVVMTVLMEFASKGAPPKSAGN
jgi:hypothetical protein